MSFTLGKMKGPNNAAWLKKYDELKQYKDREGHCNVPQRFSLGLWVNRQRQLYRYMRQGRPSHITEQRIQHLEDIGFQWSLNDPNDDTWYEQYDELKQYKYREGHCNVPYGFSDNKSLGLWVNQQRQRYKYMRQGKPSHITEQRIRDLEDIGFQWSLKDPNDDAWYKKYDELKQYKEREGHCNVPQNFSENKSLGLWVSTQRRQYGLMKQGKPSRITEERIRHLEDIGFQWSFKYVNDDAWLKKYDELKQYNERERHCNVPKGFSDNQSLAMWVNAQRRQYGLMKQGKPSRITEDRIRHLEDIGFQWSLGDPNDDTWLRKYEELKAYKEHEGHCNVPSRCSDNKSLGKWVSNQRTQYGLMSQGRPSSITEDRIRHLEDIGFQWSLKDVNDDAWLRKYEELKAYKEREGHCNVPKGFSDNKSLGLWVSTQRRQYKCLRQGRPSHITEQRIRDLEDIGFQWRLKDPNMPMITPSCYFAP